MRQSLRRTRRHRWGGEGGFTLLELLIASAAAGIVVIGAAYFLARTGRDSGEAELTQQTLDDALVGLELLAKDVENMGVGIPFELPVQLTDDLLRHQQEVQWILRHTIQDANNVAVSRGWAYNSPADRKTGSDELWLGGAGMDLSPSGQKVNVSIANGTVDTVYVAFWDIDGPTYAGGGLLSPAVDEYITVVGPGSGSANQIWRNNFTAGPVRVRQVQELAGTPGVLEVRIDTSGGGGFAETPRPGDYVYSSRSLQRGSFAPPWFLQSAHWYLNQEGVLVRRFYPNPEYQPNVYVDLPILRNVVDFQVSFLIWPCNSATPTWVDDLQAAFFAPGAPYHPDPGVIGLANRFMAMRERLQAIRVRLLIRLPVQRKGGKADPLFASETDTDYQLDDHLNTNLDRDYLYTVVEQVFDPVNLRLKTGTSQEVKYPRIISRALDQRTFYGTYCDARAK